MRDSTGDALGAPCWVSLATRDLEAAQRFYGAVLGWSFRPGGLGEGLAVAEVEGAPVAGIGALAGELEVPAAWTAYFAVESADETVARIRERGGTVGVGPVSFETGGRGALATDRDGAVFGIWEGIVFSGWRVGSGHAPAWLELLTLNAFDAALFYGEVLQWTNGPCEISYEDDQVVLRHLGEPVARLNSGPVETAALQPQVRPRWRVHFRVPALEPALEAAVALGGRVMSDIEQNAAERWAALCDPDGALFTVTAALADTR
ncbi:VOC family protein [Streptomyces sp. NPDC058279]|uniref:VOC family protein n=1 Tax=Streptomyces sp. NPDC058279 TaxID=3346418 RepID=UPI0036EE0907